MEKKQNNPNPKVDNEINEGDIVYFYYPEAEKNKYAINLEPRSINRHKNTFNAVLTTSQRTGDIYPLDYLLPDGTMELPTKVICDQPIPIPKDSKIKKKGKVSEDDLKQIRKLVGKSLGIYDDTTA